MQQIFQGIGGLPDILEKIKCRNLFLVIDSSYPFLNIKEQIETLDITKIRFSDFTPNPVYEDVCKAIELFSLERCDAILAVGGGSSIDLAKCIKLAVSTKEGKAAIIPPLVSENLFINEAKLPLIAIPTTAGTGSESTHNAVMYYKGAKQTVTNEGILPDYAILEPSVLETLPLYQKKCTMMDALCQGIESWWSVNSTEESKVYSKIAVEAIVKYWREYIFDNNQDAASHIMIAANYAGRAINIAQTTAAHAMSYKITSMYGLPHGHAVAVCLPEIWEYMLNNMTDCVDTRGREYVKDTFNQISASMNVAKPQEAISFFRQMMNEIDLKNPVAENVRERDLDILSKSVNSVRLKNNPIPISQQQTREIYGKIIHKE